MSQALINLIKMYSQAKLHVVDFTREVNIEYLSSCIKDILMSNELGVVYIVTKGRVVESKLKYVVNKNLCDRCGDCLKIGCPAITLSPDGYPQVNTDMCVGCKLCSYVCKRGAITVSSTHGGS